MSAPPDSLANRRFVVAVALFGVLVCGLLGVLLGEHLWAELSNGPRKGTGFTLLLFIGAVYMVSIFGRVVIGHFRDRW